MNIKLFLFSLFILSLLGVGCDKSYTLDLSPVSTGNVPEVTNSLPYPTWAEVTSAVQFKQQVVKIDQQEELFNIVKINPTIAAVKLAIDTSHPKTINQWREVLQATVVTNAGYFDEHYQPTTRVVINQQPYGPVLTGQTGTVYTKNGSDWLFDTQANHRNESPLYSLQSYPLLIQDHKPTVTKSSDAVAQRTIIAQDDDNNLYLIITEYGVLSLNQLDDVVANALGLSLRNALNLDGGTSTGLVVTSPTVNYDDGSALLPAVLYIQ